MRGRTAGRLLVASGKVSRLTISGGTSVVLTSVTAFTSLDKTKKIVVTLTGAFGSSASATPAFDCGNLSTWKDVDIIIDSGCTIYARGGNGGSASGGSGAQGGIGLQVNSSNSSSVLSIINNGTIAGGGGGGGAGSQSSAAGYNGLSKSCNFLGNSIAGGGGGGGGRGRNNSAGGSGSSNVLTACSAIQTAGSGGAGTTTAAGGGGIRGEVFYRPATCPPCSSNSLLGWAGASGGSWSTAGTNATVGGSGGGAGTSVANQASCAWTDNGTLL